ncbi:hypothetical protein C3747_38g284 [Trypanosoma cruzi]|uniref:Leucine-rich repeat protein (LRRP) n=2 Tax=Trypanosoma cruzi TaxID=5693 RepID=Q4D451_TRYCC|nr:hypothetical protein, conserved [Trypanosoma cruzi]EAN87306.1 hypothetical protein, conserved [Trypanosoma cruzi]PWV14175.1 hypothetical protein C3747_38g284 [Trypanosoma cruzi]RNC46260.1 hypothetical protein TcCL_NonESM03937 [Trypanosoma cruzi]|eukprot:XP_809157.1 hypothetical protein [Trypanosoma cruzi strain CL Brener]
MLPIVKEYMTECAQRRVEPYYGFIEHAGAGEIVTDLDFAPLHSVRVFALTLLRCGPRSIAVRGPKLQVLALRYDSNKGMHHPPRQSKRKVSYTTLLSQRLPEDVIVAAQNRPVLRSLIDGVRVACMTYTGHLVRVELCGLPLREIREVVTRLFDVLQHCGLLRVLNLNKSKLTDQLFTRLTTTVNTFPSLKEGHFSECGLTDGSARGIHSLILLNRGREQNAMWRASLRDGVGGHVATFARGLEVLDLSGNCLSDATIRRLGLAIAHDASLRVIDMSRNTVTTAGLKEFLQRGTLQESAVESLDLSKNLIDTKDKFFVGDNFACQHTYGEQLLLTRLDSRERHRSASTAPQLEVSGAAVPQLRSSAADGAPLEIHHPRAVSPEDVGAGGLRSRESSPAAVLDTCEENAEVCSQLLRCPGMERPQANRSTWTASPEMFDRQSNASRRNGDRKASERSRFSYQETGKQQENQPRLNQCPPPHQTAVPFFPPLLFAPTGSGDGSQQQQQQQQWCGVPLYVPVPVSSLGAMAMPPPARSTRDVAVGTSPQPDTMQQSTSRSLSTTPLADGDVTDDGTAFEKMMMEPLQTNDWELADWRRNEQRFLESLIVRLESQENATTEMLERNYQATCDRLGAIQEEFSRQIHELLQEQRVGAERFRGELREELLSERHQQQQQQDPEAAMAEQLAQLIDTGMKRIHDQMERRSASASGTAAKAAGVDLQQPTQEYLRVVKERLSSLGW